MLLLTMPAANALLSAPAAAGQKLRAHRVKPACVVSRTHTAALSPSTLSAVPAPVVPCAPGAASAAAGMAMCEAVATTLT
jgi:hypothetical protein